MLPLIFPVTRCPENALRIGANVPAVEDVLGWAIVERIRTEYHTAHQLLPAVEKRQRDFTLLIETLNVQVVCR
jgi:hypothetical protein